MKSWLSKPKHIAIITAIGFMFFVIVFTAKESIQKYLYADRRS